VSSRTEQPPRTGGLIARRNRVAAVVTCAVGAAGTAVAALTHGPDGIWSALLALVLVLVFFSAGSLPFAVAGDGQGGRRGLAFLVLGMTYVLRLLVGVVVYGLASASADLDRRVIGLTIIGCALAWTGAHVVQGVSRRHAPSLDV
jgi:hypothetical protein